MLAVSDDFSSAEVADVNRPVSQIRLVFGNYATGVFGASASASGSDGSGNYPAAGAINGDRTELNVGAASAADNDIGLSSWRSAVAPSVTPQTLTIDMGQSRTINRIKLYHLSSHALSSYKLESSPDNAAYTLIAKTTTQSGTIATTQEVDTIDFTDVACRYVRLTIADTVVAADKANVVELEIYRLLDITDRTMSVKTSRARDYQLSNSMAATANITCSNADKFFSPSYTPTSAEIADDFLNSELKPGLGVIITFGFDFTGSQEYAQNFVGTIDRLTIKPGARTASIDCRDAMKAAFNKVVSTKLKTSQDVGTLVQYMLNKVNISSWESDVDQTNITIDYFFTFDETVIETIHQLVEGSGDASFFFDENGIATFRSYLRSTAMNHTDSSEADFELGTRTDIDTTSDAGKFTMKWFKVDSFADGDFSSNPAWSDAALDSSGNPIATHISAATGVVVMDTSFATIGFLSSQFLITPFSAVTGTWECKYKTTGAGVNKPTARLVFMSNAGSPSTSGVITNGYSVEVNPGAVGRLARHVGTTLTSLGTFSCPIQDASFHTIRVTRTSAGLMTVYLDGVSVTSATDTTFTASTLISLTGLNKSFLAESVSFDDVYWSPVIEASEAVADQGVFVSQTIDQTALVSTESIFQSTQITPTDTTITWYTATSADGVSWDAYVAVTPGGAIGSTPRRYIRYKAVLDSTAFLVSPTVTDATVHWNVGSGSDKFPSSVSFVFDETLNMDLDQIYADTVAGGTAIVNSVSVKAEPLVLAGANADVQWQGTTGTPPVNISVSNPLGITNGQTLTYEIVVEGGMDTSRMSGASPAAAAITFAGGGAATWVFSSIHPTRPVLVLTITGTGTITNLQVQGKGFSSDDTFLQATATDSDSIEQFGERENQLSNKYIVNTDIAQDIADRLIENLADAVTYTPQVKVRPTLSIQIGDRVTLKDTNLGIEEDSIVIGVDQFLLASQSAGDAYTILKLLKIPT